MGDVLWRNLFALKDKRCPEDEIRGGRRVIKMMLLSSQVRQTNAGAMPPQVPGIWLETTSPGIYPESRSSLLDPNRSAASDFHCQASELCYHRLRPQICG
jgi:hypothetical protein